MGVSNKAAYQRVLYSIIVILAGYVAIDLIANHMESFPALHHLSACSRTSRAALSKESLDVKARSVAGEEDDEPAKCRTLEGHLDIDNKSVLLENQVMEDDPYRQMKWIGPPSACRVRGLLIERLDPEMNFRRGFSLRHASDVEDKTHLLPWLLAARVDLGSRRRRVLLDLGANSFFTSLTWFLRMYPLDFTEVHAFEVDDRLLRKPTSGFSEYGNIASPNQWSLMVKQTPGIPPWMLDRISLHHSFVSDFDDDGIRAINITRFVKEKLALTAADAVIVKMDIEGSEWPILNRWMADSEMAAIVDELFVEVHYDHPSMRGYHWARFSPTKRESALALLAELRLHGFFAHAWP